ncbi:hypothetical protein PROFUN_12649, partial [Planoprotostelium fungivorum]
TGSVCVVKFLHGPTSMTTDQKEQLLRDEAKSWEAYNIPA